MARRSPRKPRLAPEVRLRAALTEVNEAIRMLAQRAGAPLPDALSVDLRPRAKPAERTRAVLAEIDAALTAARPSADLWRDGAVHCFWCSASDCQHATPPSPGSVFAGYAATGKAEWTDFVQSCVDRRLPGLDGLFAEPPRPVAFVQHEELTGDMLPAFGQDDLGWTLRGQVCVGMVPADLAAPRGDRVALSVQIVETRQPGAPLALRLNVVGFDLAALATAAANGPPRGMAEQVRRAIQHARRAVGRVGRRAVVAEARGDAYDADQAIASLLGHLRADLVRVFSLQQWRTRHAEERHVDGRRPTSAALGDARDAADDRLLHDTRRETIVVIGPRSRAHVFTPAGQHVTSLRLQPGELDRKLGRQRWQPLRAAQIAAFRAALARA